jgi:predicted adenine nucleotide alpha hydrolase (AANH) superfamily ATPase
MAMQISVLYRNNHNVGLMKFVALSKRFLIFRVVYCANVYSVNKQLFTSDEN